MQSSKPCFSVFLLFVCTAFVTAGCQTVQDHAAESKEALLSAAGFQMKQAGSDEQLQDVRDLPQRRFVAHTVNGQVLYVFADAASCQCIYVGSEKNYQQYQKMAYDKDLTDEKEMTAELNETNSLNWGIWGGWGPWW